MNRLVLATGNKKKVAELNAMLEGMNFKVMPQSDFLVESVAETGTTFVENAIIKARHAAKVTGLPAIADDSGLEVDALRGAPGVYSARYAGGEGHDSEANMAKLLANLEDKADRRARFRTVVALILDEEQGREELFEGIVTGEIIRERRGGEGFGYDPVFRPDGYDRTFAELGHEVKNKISHRAKAVAKLVDYLKRLPQD